MDADFKVRAKLSGYLEKKGKMKVMSSYKKYWFVLEDRLLLYYRSKDEYDSLSPFKGSINLGPPCTVKPCSSQTGAFQIETRTNTITLRAENREEQNKWMHAIMSSLNQNNSTPTRLSHFRYSLDEISNIEVCESKESESSISPSPTEPGIIKKLQKLGAQSYITPNPNHSSQQSLNNELSISNYLQYKNSDSNVNSRKAVSTSKLPTTDADIIDTSNNNKIVYNDMYGTIKSKYRSLSMERLPSIIIENDQYKNYNQLYNRLTSQSHNNLVENDIYGKPNFIFSQAKVISNSNSLYDINVYEEPLIDHNDNFVKVPSPLTPVLDNNKDCKSPDRTGTEDVQKTKKSKKKDKEKDKPKEKKEGLIHRVLKIKSKKNKDPEIKNNIEEEEENIYEAVPESPKTESTDENKIQILNELQHILEMKKSIVKKLSTSEDIIEENTLYNTPVQVLPLLPPKHKALTGTSPYHDIPKSVPVKSIPLPPKKKKLQHTKSVDEILVDLEMQKTAEKAKPTGKVKKLVKQFSLPHMGEVELRKKKEINPGMNRYSDELTMLLDQLSQVTHAPLLTPGTTSSLVTPNLTDDELLKLLPIRRRRLSEPDYDIPRSHISLVNIPKDTTDSPIQATRFFGPVLPTDNLINESSSNSSYWNSMTPDSLEADLDLKSQHPPIKQQLSLDEDRHMSYTSHNYYSSSKSKMDLKKQRSCELERQSSKTSFASLKRFADQNVIYAEPHKNNSFCLNYHNERTFLKDVNRINEMFIDSLDGAHETSTPF